jgi:hypothetical protein
MGPAEPVQADVMLAKEFGKFENCREEVCAVTG